MPVLFPRSSGFEPGAIGPLISKNYVPEKITTGDLAAASVVWGLTVVWTGICIWQAITQTRRARNPLESTYVWMIWIELCVCFAMGLQCWCFIMKWIHPSFVFYFFILVWWCVQVQLLLQIIINRVRVISLSRDKAKSIMIGTAIVVTLINISVFNVWIPARLQISERYIKINEVWDRCEKVIYLVIDAVLNAYFISAVKKNLVHNGLQKYNSLLKFNIRIIFLSLLCDVMIIAAMSIPNSFVYIQFHPLAYLIKLNIEMTMAALIRKIAISTAAKRRGRNTARGEFVTDSKSGSGGRTGVELTTTTAAHCADPEFIFDGKGIQKTQEVVVHSSVANPDFKIAMDSDQLSNSSTKEDQNSTRMYDDDMPIVKDHWDPEGRYRTG
ncbi:uncharacterized protein K452DRAFT_228204 [Aplosporella prunicola CBS 121167]|uniref:Uncharacterized protein n=1 Tax=Aplosporella prunicola CBS 121167 TaxID=1176127 RepID=A0A6A6BC55_9PEZI|nr:uncharacterized protein K452DRAFT_228204 [Aplosporella prunicola CBS 121167]KAF2141626.1 hypothetical protein K452DRAFT_228204 [Aplosporella prunicola CBS 121167]